MRISLLSGICILFSLSTLWAQAIAPATTTRQIDIAVSRSSLSEIHSTLDSSKKSVWYPSLEDYVLRRSRQLVIENKLDFAKDVTLSIIDRNFDNLEAVSLYQSIQSAIAKRDAEAAKTAQVEAVEVYKQAAAETKIKQEAAKTYQTVTNTSTGKKVYLDQDFNTHYRDYTWDFVAGLANASYVLGPPGENGIKFGVSIGTSVFYHGESFTVGGELDGCASFITLNGSGGLDWFGVGSLSFAYNPISRYFVFRTGFAGLGFEYGSKTSESLLYMSPLVGLGFRDLKLGQTGKLQLSADYYPRHLYDSKNGVSIGARILASFLLADMQDFDIHFYTGVRNSMIVYNSKIKNDARLMLAIGVADYE